MKTTKLNLFTKGLMSFALVLAFALGGCTGDDNQPNPGNGDNDKQTEKKVYVMNAGGFGKNNATLDLYLPEIGEQILGRFRQVNGIGLGDTAQSIQVEDDDVWICVSTSQVIYHLDAKTDKLLGQIGNIPKPRYIHFVSDTKAYVSHYEYPNITIINPKTHSKIGEIETFMNALPEDTPGRNLNTEQFLELDDDKVLVSCWSGQETVLLIDEKSDKVIREIKVGSQPKYMDIDKNDKVWVLCEGESWKGVNPTLYTIDTKSDYAVAKICEIEKLPDLKYPPTTGLKMLDNKEEFLYINAPHIFKMKITDTVAPTAPFIKLPSEHTIYAFDIAPNKDIYIADAIDYSQQGVAYRYDEKGNFKVTFLTGVIPAGFAFYDAD